MIFPLIKFLLCSANFCGCMGSVAAFGVGFWVFRCHLVGGNWTRSPVGGAQKLQRSTFSERMGKISV